MSKEIIVEEDDISEFEVISAKEDQEGYRMKSTFDNRKLQKIQNLNFDLKAPGEGLLSYLNKKKKLLRKTPFTFIVVFYHV